MDKKTKISESRGRLESSISLPDLSNEELLKSIVENQLLSSLTCSEGEMEQIVTRRTKEVSNLLDMLRSASENKRKDNSSDASHIDWKLKQDTDELRVMYREGSNGSPFHNLLAEGFADGPLDVCLCATWETTLYHKWWPQFSLPTFKILVSACLKKVRVGEEISLIRVKVPWPISDREALLYYFEIEYLEEDLILVLMNTISDTQHVDATMDGITNDEIPEPKDATRIDLVGGVVMQKVDLDRCYFRLIFTIDVKLDFLHPSLINFFTRQLVGSGHKLFQKAVRSVVTSNEDYRKALEGPMYAHIREGMAHKKTKTSVKRFNEEKPAVPSENHVGEIAAKMKAVVADSSVSEITEEDMEQSENIKVNQLNDRLSTCPANNQQNPNQEISHISPEVEHALDILDQCIVLLRKYDNHIVGSQVHQDSHAPKASSEAGTVANEDALEVRTDTNKMLKTSEAKLKADDSSSGASSDERSPSSDPEVDDAESAATHDMPARSTLVKKALTLEGSNKVSDERSIEGNGVHVNAPFVVRNKDGRWKKWICCFNPCLARS